MFTLKVHIRYRKPSFSVISCLVKELKISAANKYESKVQADNSAIGTNNLNNLIKKYNEKIIYNNVVEGTKLKLGYVKNQVVMDRRLKFKEKVKLALQTREPLPVTLKYISNDLEYLRKDNYISRNKNSCDNIPTNFPFETKIPVIKNDNGSDIHIPSKNVSPDINMEIRIRNKLSKTINNWMSSYDNYESDLMEKDLDDRTSLYGTPDPKSSISNVPCGGCGSLLHCKDTGIPGYIPSEIFKNYHKKGASHLNALICQRCHFLKEYNLALQVQVSADDYPKILTVIKEKRALVVLMVDLLDFPCSIWPGLSEIFGPKIPIIVVGNKIDLLPRDSNNFLKNIKQTLMDNIQLSGFGTANIKDVCLISAKTGYGIEDLITTIQSVWKYKGDVYLVGCTNVGKSSLFNALLQSDFCKTQASDLIQRATISLWPGTTLNLLKFPITRPSGYKLYVRHQRLQKQKQLDAMENRHRQEYLKKHDEPEYATLIGHIGRSYFKQDQGDELKDNFSVSGTANASGKFHMGINENHPDYALSKWCFDTPGVVQPDQIIHLLTTDELMKVLPKELIRPESYCVKAGTTLFIGGLGRLDYMEGGGSIRVTVFKSRELPITICKTEDADKLYEELLGTELLQVPSNTGDRLSKWPGLQMGKTFRIRGTSWKLSSADIILSSAGWIAINCSPENEYVFQAWTPEKRGIYLRDCLLPNAVTLRGRRIKNCVAYGKHKLIT